jgi:molybdenum cofactor cytidylyltransferase
MRTFGLIPAAGLSTRMGRPKLLLPLAGRTVLDRVVSAVRAAGVADVLVVVAPDAAGLHAVAEGAGAHVLRLPEPTPDMRGTCQAGLDWLEARLAPRPDDGWLLLPADHPTVRPDVVRALLGAAAADPRAAIVVPTHAGRRGHPVWLRWPLAAAARALPPDQGLNRLIRSKLDETREIDWPMPDVLRDLDTPEDYQRLVGEMGE